MKIYQLEKFYATEGLQNDFSDYKFSRYKNNEDNPNYKIANRFVEFWTSENFVRW